MLNSVNGCAHIEQHYNHTILSVYGTEKVILDAHQRRLGAVILSVMQFGKCPQYFYFLGVGEVVLPRGAPITLTQMISMILAGSFQ